MWSQIILPVITWVMCAISVASCYATFRWAMRIRSHSSLQDEIKAIDDCVRSLIKSIQRIEGRQTAKMRPGSSATSDTISDLDKDVLRARYFTPGNAMRHVDGQHSRDPA